jgi:acetyltransferase
LSIKNLNYLFAPKTIAVLGADEDESSIGYHAFKNLINNGLKVAVYPVNPRYGNILGIEAYESMNYIRQPVDLAIVACPPDDLYAALDECGQKKVKGVIILAPDFEYKVRNPHSLSDDIRKLASIYGYRILGPNTLGFIRPGNDLIAGLFPIMPPKGNIAFISQSGIFSSAFLEQALAKHVGFSFFISLGGTLDINFPDLIDFLGVDAQTRAIVLHVQQIKNGRRFMAAVRSFADRKPIVVVKSGMYDLSSEVAVTHSGFLAGEDKIYEAVFKRAGAVEVDEMVDIIYMAETLAKQRRPRGKHLAVISNAAVPAQIAVDVLHRMGGELALLDSVTSANIEAHLAQRMQIENPIRILSDASPADYEISVTNCLKDEGVDGILVIYVPFPGVNPVSIAEAVLNAARTNPAIPLFTAWLGEETVHKPMKFLNSHGIPTYFTPERAVKSFIYMHRYDYNLQLLRETPEVILKNFKADIAKVKTIIAGVVARKGVMLQINETAEILKTYGIPVVETIEVQSEMDAITQARRTGYPVAMKLDSEILSYHREREASRLNLIDDNAVSTAYHFLKEMAACLRDSAAKIIIQPMAEQGGLELSIGAKRSMNFGSVIVFGIGGTLREAEKDYSIGLPPLNQTLARRMLEETKIYQYLQHRQEYNASLKKLEEVLVRFSRLIIDIPEIDEIDINPILFSENGIVALDANMLHIANIEPGEQKTITGDLCPSHLSIPPYPAQYCREIIAPNGAAVLIRPIRAEDEPIMYKLLKSLSDESVYSRFCRLLKDMPHEKLVRFCQIDYDREIAFVASVRGESESEELIGEVRISKLPDLESAEISILVSDQWQGKGIGNMLMDYCIDIARKIELKSLWMEILKENRRMIRFGLKYGFRQSYDDGDMVKVVLNLTQMAV